VEAKGCASAGFGRGEATGTMSLQLLLIVAAIGVVPVVSRLFKAIMELLVRLIATAFTVLFVVLVLAVLAAHGKLF
jgi:hypothetical protein